MITIPMRPKPAVTRSSGDVPRRPESPLAASRGVRPGRPVRHPSLMPARGCRSVSPASQRSSPGSMSRLRGRGSRTQGRASLASAWVGERRQCRPAPMRRALRTGVLRPGCGDRSAYLARTDGLLVPSRIDRMMRGLVNWVLIAAFQRHSPPEPVGERAAPDPQPCPHGRRCARRRDWDHRAARLAPRARRPEVARPRLADHEGQHGHHVRAHGHRPVPGGTRRHGRHAARRHDPCRRRPRPRLDHRQPVPARAGSSASTSGCSANHPARSARSSPIGCRR